jgi:hypothetical protein
MTISSMIITIVGIILIAAFVSLIRAVKHSVQGHEDHSGFMPVTDHPASFDSVSIISISESAVPSRANVSARYKLPSPSMRHTATPFG